MLKVLLIFALTLTLPAHAADWKFWLANGAHAAAAVADVEITAALHRGPHLLRGQSADAKQPRRGL